MKKKLLLFSMFLFGPLCLFAQSAAEHTFTIETLERPKDLLPELTTDDALKSIAPQQWVHSSIPSAIVNKGAHPFFDGMYTAYAEHRPFVLSPDMIWLLISQGFSHHVNNNAEALRSMSVNFDGKKSLVVMIDESTPLNQLSTWESVIPQFVKQVSDNTGSELMANLTPEFSTTGRIEKTVYQLTALESMQAYFEYIVIRMMCGIPELTIKGTPQDWQLLKDKTDALRKYKLDWWIDELDPLLDQFINASNNKFDKHFWRNMFKYHTEKEYGAPKIIDGWIIKFFPYDKKGKRNDLKMLRSSENLPAETAVVDFVFKQEQPNGIYKSSAMQFVAGFYGLKQHHKTQALEPQMGWWVQAKTRSDDFGKEMDYDLKKSNPIHLRVSEVPVSIMGLKEIKSLEMEFLDSIKIPAELSLVKIDYLSLTGKVSSSEVDKIEFLFPYTILKINGISNQKIPDSILVNDSICFINKISDDHWKYVFFSLMKKEQHLSDIFKGKQIDILEVDCNKITQEDKMEIIKAYPNTYLTINGEVSENKYYYEQEEMRKRRYKQWISENGTAATQ